jgi:tRNA A-37 threonylcarbamoyl transferase component Bud32
MTERVRSIWIVPAKSACAEEIVVGRSLRILPGTREVSNASWRGRDVVLKVFCHRWKARRHYRRELRGLRRLAGLGFRAPVLLLSGRTKQGHWAVVTEKIQDALTGLEIWRQADTLERKVDLLCQIAAELARQHDKGVIQSDMHLGNFIIRDEEVFALDPAMMSFRWGPIGPKRSIRLVARLVSMLPEDAGPAIDAVFQQYGAARSWSIGLRDMEQLRTRQRRCRRRAIERGLRKFLRTNRHHQAIRRGPWRGLADRRLSEAVGLDEITAGLDETMSQGQILKDGRTSFVSRVKLGGIEIVVKRYNHKGLLHSLRHTLKKSRAKRSWLNANRLLLVGIATPRPLAYVEEYRGPLLHRSYFITEFVCGPSLAAVLKDPTLGADRKQHVVDDVLRLLDRLARQGISHGDMKHSNLICHGAEVFLTDLDAMQVHRAGHPDRRYSRKDRARLLRELDRNRL